MKISTAKLKEALEFIFVFLVLQFSAGAIITLVRRAGTTDAYAELSASAPALQAVWFLIYLIAIYLSIVRRKQFIRVVKRDILLLLLVGIAITSTFWSTFPDITLRRSLALIGTTWFGMYVATRYNSREILKILVWTLSIGALLSVVFVVALPGFGLSMGAWRGIYQHKNLLGRLMAVNAVLLLLLKPNKRIHQWALWAFVGLSIGLTLMSTSKGALLFLLVIITLLPLYKALRWKYTIAIPFAITVLLVNGSLMIWVLDNLENILVNQLGKDMTFTGRTQIWEAAFQMIEKRPLLGYGYSGFWQGWNSPSELILSVTSWAAPNSHNGFLDLCLDLGFVGLVVFMLGLLVNFIRAVKQARLSKTAEDLWPLVIITSTVLFNLNESAILKQNDFSWILYVLAVFARPDQRY